MPSPLAGLGTNIDVNTLVSGLMAAERVPLNALTAKNAQHQANLSAFGTAKGALSNVQTASRTLSDAMTSIPASVNVSTPAVATATAQAGTTPANISLSVQTLAQAHRIYSGAFAAATTVVGSGVIAIDRGSFDGATFTANANIPAVTITIPPNATVTTIRDAINNAGAGITASIVNDGAGFRLVLGANDTGAAQGMRIRTTDDDSGNTDAAGLSQLAFDPEAAVGTGRNLTQARAGSDATFSVDGLPMTRPSNDVSDAIGGVSFKLLAAGDTNVGVTRDLTKMRIALDDLVKAYNSTSATLKSQSSFDVASGNGGPLNGESSIRGVLSQMRKIITSSYGVDGDAYRTLSSLGVSGQSNGQLTVDTKKYEAAMGADPVAASKMISSFARALSGGLDSALGSDGPLAARTDGIQTAMKRVTDQQARMEARMSAIEARYRAQFSALDGMLSSMNSTTAFLTQQFNNSSR